MSNKGKGKGWPCAALDQLLQDLEEHKGSQSPYLISRRQALDHMVLTLNKDFGMQLDRKQVNNQLYNIWESFRRPNYINARILVFYKEGRGVLNSFCDHDVLQLRGAQENERGFKSDLAKQTIKRFGLTETAGSGRHRSVTLDARFKPPKRLIKRVPKSRERGSSFIDGRRVSRRGTTSG